MFRPFPTRASQATVPFRSPRPALFLFLFLFAVAVPASAQDHEDEIVANLAGGRVIVHVARDAIIFAAIDQPVEAHSIPPRVADVDSSHIGVLFGASEWRIPARSEEHTSELQSHVNLVCRLLLEKKKKKKKINKY